MMKLTTKKPLRFLAALMVVVLLVTCIPLNVFGANEEFLPFDPQTTENNVGDASGILENDNVSVIEENVIGEYVEDISKREENVKHFANPDGTYTAIVYPTAVHRKDADGVWQDINNDLALTTVKGSEKYASTDSRVSFASRFAPSAELMTLSENGYSISMSLISDSKNDLTLNTETQSFGLASVTNAAKKELPKTNVKLEDVARVDNKSSILYNNVRANTDIEYILDGNDVKENIIVKAPLSSYKYAFDLRLDGLVAILNENGSISITDAETGAAKYAIPAPYMFDANGNTSTAVEYTLIEVSSGRYLLTVTADKTWINSTGRAFPVTIDPTIVPDTMMCDTYVSQYSPDTSYFYDSDLLVGYGYTALMLLDYPELPIGSTFNNAYLYMNYYFDSSFMDAIDVGAYEITSSWEESTATYNDMPSISSDVLSTTTLYGDMGTASSPYMVQMSITDALSNWYCGDSDNYGIAIEYLAGIGTANIKSYDSGYNTCEFISVTYTVSEADYFYLINNYNGKYLHRTGNVVNCMRGKSSSLGVSTVKWYIYDLNEEYCVIQRSDMANYYLVPDSSSNGSGVKLSYYSNSASLPDNYKWSITSATYGGVLIKNKASGYYLSAASSTANSSSVCMYPLSASGTDLYDCQRWSYITANNYTELGDNVSFDDITMDIDETKNASVNKSPQNATWSTYKNFDYTITSGSEYVSYDPDTKEFTGVESGSATITAIHKTTGISTSFNINVAGYASADLAALAFATRIYASSLYIRHEYGTIIYKITKNGSTLYFYTSPVAGTPHSVEIPTNSVPLDGTIVAYSHTHPNRNGFTETDKNSANNAQIHAYVNGPNLEVIKYDYTTKEDDIHVGYITPTPLTNPEKQALVSAFYDSWQNHISAGSCEFNCDSITWPTP